jgi:ComF family protein
VLADGAKIENLLHVRILFSRVLDTLLPPNCLACDALVEQDGQFCLACFRRANFVSAPLCAQCGVPLTFGHAAGAGGKCAKCAAEPPAFTQARAALRYDATAQRLIMPFKYGDRTEAARGIARLMRRPGAGLLAAADVLVPVPLHKSRLRARRYNQAALLAAELARMARLPCIPDALIRGRATQPLAGMGLAARQAEMQDAIALRPGFAGAGKAVLLIDDIMTSGTIANACAAALLAGGAARVDVLTAARVADPAFA